MGARVLLVEGPSDVDFFARLVRQLEGKRPIEVRPPRDYDRKNTVTVIPGLLPDLVKQLGTGQIAQLGIVADADHHSGGGASARWDAIAEPLRAGGYHVPSKLPKRPNLGSMFKHPDGLPPVGVWLMPDHQSNGMLEDLILRAAADAVPQPDLLRHARGAINDLPSRLFGATHTSKALVYTWLAWQRRPGLGLSVALDADLLDRDREPLKGLVAWLGQVFPPPDRAERERAAVP